MFDACSVHCQCHCQLLAAVPLVLIWVYAFLKAYFMRLKNISEQMPRQTNFDKFKLHTDRSVVNELKAEIWNTKEVTDLRYPNHLNSITSRFFAKHDPCDISESEESEPVQSFVTSSLQTHCHQSKPASEDVRIKLHLLKERLHMSSSEVSSKCLI